VPASLQPETKSPSRRALLAGALGGLGALAASAIGRASPVRAANNDPITVGNAFTGTSTTTISNSSNSNSVFEAASSAGGAGVLGTSNSSYGVAGSSASGNGVYGQSSSSNGVWGESFNAGASGVYGENTNHGYGVAGRSNAAPLISGIDASALLGDNTADGIGVWARSAHGIGLFAEAVNADAVALKAQGVAQFTRSGKLTILAGHASVTKSSIRIDAGSLLLAVLQQDRSGIFVRSAVPNATGDSFTIHLNKAVASDTKVGWFIVN
jgi:hypothetical protein